MTIEELRIKGLLGWALEKGSVPGGFIFYCVFFLLAGVIGYLLGSINCSLLISKAFYKDDIRKHGSGNAGMTNMMRTYGKKAAALTLLGDALKGALSVFAGFLFCGTYSAYFAALLCTVGHAYPIFFGFKGGKGVVVTAVTVLCLNPLVFAILFLLFVIIVAVSKYISLGSVICMFLYPLLLSKLQGVMGGLVLDTTEILGTAIAPGYNMAVLLACLNAAFVIWLHRSNIKRLYYGEENKFSFKKSVPKTAETKQTGKPSEANEDAESSVENKTLE